MGPPVRRAGVRLITDIDWAGTCRRWREMRVSAADCHASSIQTGVMDSTSRSSPSVHSRWRRWAESGLQVPGRMKRDDWFRCRSCMHVTADVTDADFSSICTGICYSAADSSDSQSGCKLSCKLSDFDIHLRKRRRCKLSTKR